MAPAEGKKPGRRAFQPSEDDRATVRRMAGARHQDIARVIGISVPTLRKAFAEDLKASKAADLFSAEAAPATPRRQRQAVGGRKPFQPQDWHRRKVRELAACGKQPSAIARIIGISEPTLRKHFAEELATGAEKIEAELIAALMTKARAGSVSAIREARAILAQARLDGMEDKLRASAPPPKPDTPGKKLQASLEAAEVIATAPWAEHLRPH